MKTLKLIIFMLLVANFVVAQTTFYGNLAGLGVSNNSHYGYQAGYSANGSDCVFLGALAGKNAVNATNDVGIGYYALGNSNGANNMAIGFAAGASNDTGGDNVFMGGHSGKHNVSGSSNIYLGATAGSNNTDGNGNIAIGRGAGSLMTTGGYNVFIGNGANAELPNVSNKLYIQSQHQNSTDTTALIYGDFAAGKVGIETDYVPSDYTLAVNGKTITEEVQVLLRTNWPDYVFAEDYNLMPLTDLEAEIETLGHLPGVPSAEEVEENGHALGQMDAILLEKIEELTLHLIKINKEVEELRQENVILKNNAGQKK